MIRFIFESTHLKQRAADNEQHVAKKLTNDRQHSAKKRPRSAFFRLAFQHVAPEKEKRTRHRSATTTTLATTAVATTALAAAASSAEVALRAGAEKIPNQGSRALTVLAPVQQTCQGSSLIGDRWSLLICQKIEDSGAFPRRRRDAPHSKKSKRSIGRGNYAKRPHFEILLKKISVHLICL